MNLKSDTQQPLLENFKEIFSLRNKVEAILFLSTEPISSKEIATKLSVDTNLVRKALSQLLQDYENRETALMIDTEKGYFMRVKDEYADLSDEVLTFELKTASLRTLSTIALKEPIYQKDLVELRGGSCYEHLKDLESLGLIKRQKEGINKIVRTTKTFAEYFKLTDNGMELQHILKNPDNNVKFVRN
ncbi:MAG: SMC-Scp complex subunit ScpB [Candidatus Caenarcaniphilales bacterium]|nr:SMC-Scp complex subunit ScpB [Candidatus Caenarcaniphilales bacterium]